MFSERKDNTNKNSGKGSDYNLTKKITAACELMDIRLLDHIIVTPWYSFYSYCNETDYNLMHKTYKVKNMLSHSPTYNIFCKFAHDFSAIELADEINNFIKRCY